MFFFLGFRYLFLYWVRVSLWFLFRFNEYVRVCSFLVFVFDDVKASEIGVWLIFSEVGWRAFWCGPCGWRRLVMCVGIVGMWLEKLVFDHFIGSHILRKYLGLQFCSVCLLRKWGKRKGNFEFMVFLSFSLSLSLSLSFSMLFCFGFCKMGNWPRKLQVVELDKVRKVLRLRVYGSFFFFPRFLSNQTIALYYFNLVTVHFYTSN